MRNICVRDAPRSPRTKTSNALSASSTTVTANVFSFRALNCNCVCPCADSSSECVYKTWHWKFIFRYPIVCASQEQKMSSTTVMWCKTCECLWFRMKGFWLKAYEILVLASFHILTTCPSTKIHTARNSSSRIKTIQFVNVHLSRIIKKCLSKSHDLEIPHKHTSSIRQVPKAGKVKLDTDSRTHNRRYRAIKLFRFA